MVAGPWDDPTIQSYVREWRASLQRCVKAVHPRCNVDQYGRMYGTTNSGGRIDLNYEPDGIAASVAPPSREYYYCLLHTPLGTQFYPLTAQQYVEQRQAGVSPASLTACTP